MFEGLLISSHALQPPCGIPQHYGHNTVSEKLCSMSGAPDEQGIHQWLHVDQFPEHLKK